MAKDFVHAIVLPQTRDKAHLTAKHLNLEINQVYEEAVSEYAVKKKVPLAEGECNGE